LVSSIVLKEGATKGVPDLCDFLLSIDLVNPEGEIGDLNTSFGVCLVSLLGFS